ncbi:MAG TPA: hypothetical protein VMB19_03335 [Silvibacterium sp.]|nr:hypothetical protein [Silvibacterium sp.]
MVESTLAFAGGNRQRIWLERRPEWANGFRARTWALLRTHFWTMMLVAGLIVAHVVRNRP